MRELLQDFLRRPDRSGIFLDFDGTLADIVPVASDARPVQGTKEVLVELADQLSVVAIVSGRSAQELLEWLGPDVEIWGVHGAQRTQDGKVVLADSVQAHVELMSNVKREAEEAVAKLADPGLFVEDKTVVVALHWRAARDRDSAQNAMEDIAARLVDRYGLILVAAKMTIELRPPVELSKSAVVLDRARAAGLEAVAFVGDDSVDLPAFDALDELGRDGASTLRVAVRSDESPDELLRRADLVVDGPAGVIELLNAMGRS